MPFDLPNTASTLSPFFSPGEDLRYFATTPNSISTIGDYRVDSNLDQDSINRTLRNLSFDQYESLNSMKATGSSFSDKISVFVQQQELNLDFKKPHNLTYFSSFKTESVKGIAEIISTFPYAIYVTSGVSSVETLYDYSRVQDINTNKIESTFKIPTDSLVNQGNVLLNSGYSYNNNSLFNNSSDYVIHFKDELSTGSTNPKFQILKYVFSVDCLEVTVKGDLLTGQSVVDSYSDFYIAPSPKVIYKFKKELTPLKNQLIFSGKYKIANPILDDGSTIEVTYEWPKSVDGYNPDTYGTDFETWKFDFLDFSETLDCDKTNIMAQTMIPDAYFDFDSDSNIYANITQSHAQEFDVIKQYIDGLVYAHTATYDGTESVPDKFIFKLSKLLGFDLSPQFNEVDLLRYLSGDEDGEGNSAASFNLQLWRKILTNIIWLLKRKGTREPLLWVFQLIGAPECMVRLDEIVYDITTAASSGDTGTLLEGELSFKSKINGFPDYQVNPFIFQEGGLGRGNGMNYIDYWRPQYDPVLRFDNVKTQSGDTVYFGTENIINSKQLYCALDPAQAIECNVHEWYQLSGTVWNYSYDDISLADWDYPFQWVPEDQYAAKPTGATEHISGMTHQEYMTFLFTNNVDPRTRKTNDQSHTTFYYPALKNIYLNYSFLKHPISSRITMSKLENFIKLIERKFFNYGKQLLPATSILLAQGVIYRNTEFHRERFIYKDGINKGSEFKVDISQPESVVFLTEVLGEVNEEIDGSVDIIEVSNEISQEIEGLVNLIDVSNEITIEISTSINTYNIVVEISDDSEDTTDVSEVDFPLFLDDISNIIVEDDISNITVED